MAELFVCFILACIFCGGCIMGGIATGNRVKTEDTDTLQAALVICTIFLLSFGIAAGFIAIGWLVELANRVYYLAL